MDIIELLFSAFKSAAKEEVKDRAYDHFDKFGFAGKAVRSLLIVGIVAAPFVYSKFTSGEETENAQGQTKTETIVEMSRPVTTFQNKETDLPVAVAKSPTKKMFEFKSVALRTKPLTGHISSIDNQSQDEISDPATDVRQKSVSDSLEKTNVVREKQQKLTQSAAPEAELEGTGNIETIGIARKNTIEMIGG